jgi:hypothetical protein
MLLNQYRLHYFGFFALVTGSLLVIEQLRAARHWQRGMTFVVAFALIALAYQPALRERLFLVYAAGGAPDYASMLGLYLGLGTACGEDPGIVLASSDDGTAILFHSDCSVIASNFILTPEDGQHIAEISRLMGLAPDEIRRQRPDIKYVLLRARDFLQAKGDDAVELSKDNLVAQQLLTKNAPPPGFSLVKTVQLEINDQGDTQIFARLYKIVPVDSASGG